MSPHANAPDSPPTSYISNQRLRAFPDRSTNVNIRNEVIRKNRSHLRVVSQDEVHDLVCVGFGPASLAIAVALHDAVDQAASGPGRAPQLRTDNPKVAFVERQPQFAWHAGMQIPGAKMQISFIKDLATLRNPRSEFTFVNYLHSNDRLVQFTNVGTFLPRRLEYEDYMRWCAGWFEELVAYGEEVLDVQAIPKGKATKSVGGFSVTLRNMHTKEISTRRGKNVVIAVGGRPRIPDSFPQKHPRILHSSQYRVASSKIFADRNRPLKIAVIGSGQSAAEIFNDLPSQFPNSKSYLLVRGAALRPSDDSPFVNEVFDPNRVDDIYSQDPAVRKAGIALDRGTNYGVVRLELLEHIYDDMYTQRIKSPSPDDWPHQILTHRSVTSIADIPGDASGRVRLQITNDSATHHKARSPAEETLDVDLVLVASGYERDMHEDMLKSVRHLMPGGDEQGKRWTVGRDYRVEFEEGAVSEDAGVWLQGCNESTHGLSDTLLSILAVRGGEMVQSIFGEKGEEDCGRVDSQ